MDPLSELHDMHGQQVYARDEFSTYFSIEPVVIQKIILFMNKTLYQ